MNSVWKGEGNSSVVHAFGLRARAAGLAAGLLALWAWGAPGSLRGETVAVEGAPFGVRRERPRVFVRATPWAGPHTAKMKEWFQTAEYRKRGVERQDLFQYLVSGDRARGKKALDALLKNKISGSSPSYSGQSAQMYASAYDWLRGHPDFDEEKRLQAVAHLEQWGDNFSAYLSRSSSSIFYSRYPGAIGGLTAIGLALHGDSPKADGYIRAAHRALIEYGRFRDYEGGASGGGNYSLVHAFPDLARAVAAFESATDAGVLATIREEQGDWIRRQLEWQIWMTMPSGYFIKEGDFWRNRDSHQMRSNVDILTTLLRHGPGRAMADSIHKRYGTSDYHGGYVWDFFLFFNPEIEPEPLSQLGRATLFGQESHGYAFFRSGWSAADTVVFFKCGESLDTHGSHSTAHFDVWRGRSLAQRAAPWYNVKTRGGNCWHNNTMKFTSEGDDGKHPNTIVKNNMPLDFKRFIDWKRKSKVEAGDMVEFEIKDEYARAVADVSAAVRKSCRSWTREMVWLGYRHLLVIDRVETLDKPVQQRWMLYMQGQREMDGKLATTVLSGNKLYCRTLLPDDAALAWVEAPEAGTRLEVTPPDSNPGKRLYLHVLTATSDREPEPATTLRSEGDVRVVTVGEHTYRFAR
jgi:hypothetical protein